MLSEDRLDTLIMRKDHKEAEFAESWSVIDGALVIYDAAGPPAWLAPVLSARDEDGNTALA